MLLWQKALRIAREQALRVRRCPREKLVKVGVAGVILLLCGVALWSYATAEAGEQVDTEEMITQKVAEILPEALDIKIKTTDSKTTILEIKKEQEKQQALKAEAALQPQDPFANMKKYKSKKPYLVVPVVDHIPANSPPITAVTVCHPSWHGIRSATYQLGIPVFEVADLSNLQVQADIVEQALELSNYSTKTSIIVNGIPDGTFEACENWMKTGVRCGIVYHGSFAQHSDTTEWKLVEKMITAAREGKMWRGAFVKESIGSWFGRVGEEKLAWGMGNIRRTPFIGAVRIGKYNALDHKFHIGLFGANMGWRKNIPNQFIASCLVKGAVIHLSNPTMDLNWMDKHCNNTVIHHGSLSQIDLAFLMSAMDINLYASYSECYPMLPLESVAGGTPCLISDSSTLYIGLDESIRRALVIREPDNIISIHKAIENARRNMPRLRAAIPAILETGNNISKAQWEEYMEAKLPDLQTTKEQLNSLVMLNPLTEDAPTNNKGTPATMNDLPLLGERQPTAETERLTVCIFLRDLPGLLQESTYEALEQSGAQVILVTDSLLVMDRLKWLREDRKVWTVTELLTEDKGGVLANVSAAISKLHHMFGCSLVEMPLADGVAFDLLVNKEARLGKGVGVLVRAGISVEQKRMTEDIAGIGQPWSWTRAARRLREWYTLIRADGIVAHSEAYAKYTSELFEIPLERFHIIKPARPRERKRTPTSEEDKEVVIIGSRQYYLGQDIAVRAAVDWAEKNRQLAEEERVKFLVFPGEKATPSVPKSVSHLFEFINQPVGPEEIEHIPRFENIYAAIIAPPVPSTSTEAHAFVSMHVPLVVARTPALSSFFHEDNAYTFDPLSYSTLEDALSEAMQSNAKHKLLTTGQNLPSHGFAESSSTLRASYAELYRTISSKGGLMMSTYPERLSLSHRIKALLVLLIKNQGKLPPYI